MNTMLNSANWPLGWPLTAIAVTAILYLFGGWTSATPTSLAKRGRGAAFYAGLAILALAVSSPIDAFADTLFWTHMVQHVLLMMVAPPLLLLGRPWPRLLRPLPLGFRRSVVKVVLVGPALAPVRRLGGWLARPLQSFVVFSFVLLGWHLPVLYDLTLQHWVIHDLEHALFFGTALLFWVHLIPGASSRPQLAAGQRAIYATAALLVSWVLAIVLGLAQRPLYASYAALDTHQGSLSALADQHIAAGIMWVPGSIPYVVVIAIAIIQWLGPVPSHRPELVRQHG